MPEDDNDDDDDEYNKYDNDGLFDLPPGIPPKILPLFMEMALKHGGSKGGLPDPEKVARKDPKLIERMLDVILEYVEEGGELPDLGGDWFPSTSQASRNTRRKKGRKKSGVL